MTTSAASYATEQEDAEPTPAARSTGYIEFVNVKKVYRMGEQEIEALAGVDFSIDEGQLVIIAGASGAGKSTLLNILGGMDTLTSGSVFLDGAELSEFDQKQMIKYRRFDVGFVFQFYNLIPNLTARENVELASQVGLDPLDVDEVLASVGLAERAGNFPSQLSGGEQQRVAIARALAKNPKLLLCDEPTGALDSATGIHVLQALEQVNATLGTTTVVITHNVDIARMAHRVLTMADGRIVREAVNAERLAAKELHW